MKTRAFASVWPAKRIRYCARSGRWDYLFSLTPALSLRERENGRQRFREAGAPWIVETQAALLPLLKGEGWGEGKDDNPTDFGFRKSNLSHRSY
jgi:hypothetical protein